MISELYNKRSLYSLSGSSMAVWLTTTVGASVFQFEADKYKWIGLVVAFAISFLGARSNAVAQKVSFDFHLGLITFFNGLLIFVTASGIDSINQGVKVQGATNTVATLIPFTENITWWPTKKLEDSVVYQKSVNRALKEENVSLVKVIARCGDSTQSLVPVVVPRSTKFSAGSNFEAKVFMVSKESGINPNISINGTLVKAQVKEESPGWSIAAPLSKMPTSKGEVTKTTVKTDVTVLGSTYTLINEIEIVKPSLHVSTGRSPVLYLNSGNLVQFDCPALGEEFNPKFAGTGVIIQETELPGQVLLIPSERQVKITVSNNGIEIGAVNFDVRPIPKPRYVARDNSGQEIDLKNGIRGGSLSGLRVTAEPEENFRTEVPQDAIFQIKSMEIIIARGTARVDQMMVTSELVDLRRWLTQYRPGDRIIIDIKSVARKTFLGEEEVVAVVGGTISIPIQ